MAYEIDDKDGALVFKEDSIEILMPDLGDDVEVSESFQLMASIGLLLKEADDRLVKYLWYRWNLYLNNEIAPTTSIEEVINLISEDEPYKTKEIIECFCTIANGWGEDQVIDFIKKHGA